MGCVRPIRPAGTRTTTVLQEVIAPFDDMPGALYLDGAGAMAMAGGAGLELDEGARIGTDRFFNAFFLSYWQSHTDIGRVGVLCRADRKLHLRAFGVRADGGRDEIDDWWVHPGVDAVRWIWDRMTGAGEEMAPVRIVLEVDAPQRTLMETLAFVTDTPPRRPVRVTACLCTHEREARFAATVKALRDELVECRVADRGLIGIVAVNQGACLRETTRAALLHPAIRVIEQGNLGGSGGYSRAMAEVLAAGDATTHLLLMDDDIRLDPRILARAIAFAAYADADLALGGQALELEEPTRLQDAGGRIGAGWVATLSGNGTDLSSSGALGMWGRPEMLDFAGWWFCLMPLEAVRRCGLPSPYFLHGDDVDYGCRLREQGAQIVSPPGLGVWHGAMRFKRTAMINYYDLRNAMINGSLHPDVAPPPGPLMVLGWIVRDLLVHRYRSALCGIVAIEDFLSDPDRVLEGNGSVRHGQVQRLLQQVPVPDPADGGQRRSRVLVRLPDVPYETAQGEHLLRVVLRHVAIFWRALLLPAQDEPMVVIGPPRPEVTLGRGYLLALDPVADRCLRMRLDRLRLVRLVVRAMDQAMRYALWRRRAARRWRDAVARRRSGAEWGRVFDRHRV